MTTVTSSRKREDWDELADRILPELREAGSITPDLRAKYQIGNDVYRLQLALARMGFDAHGQELHVRPIKVKRPGALAKQIAGRRAKGAPIWLLEVESGLSHYQMKRLMQEHGYSLARNGNGNGAS